MLVQKFELGEFATCTYVLSEANSDIAVLIDPSEETEPVLDFLRQDGKRVSWILNTHGHIDHISGNMAIKKIFPDALIAIGEEDAAMLTRPSRNLSLFFAKWVKSAAPDRKLKEGDIVESGSIKLRVLELPGHTPGGVGYFCENDGANQPILFSGDTLFAGGVGRADFPGSSARLLGESIRKIFALPGNCVVYPGHGTKTRVEAERLSNIFALELMEGASNVE